MTRIIFNGREYASLEQMPPEVRRAHERLFASLPDRDGNGIPDLLEGDGGFHQIESRIHFNGREYTCPDEMPPDVRAAYESAMNLIGGKRGISFSSGRGSLRMSFGGEDNSYLKGVIVALLILIAVLVAMLMGGG